MLSVTLPEAQGPSAPFSCNRSLHEFLRLLIHFILLLKLPEAVALLFFVQRFVQ